MKLTVLTVMLIAASAYILGIGTSAYYLADAVIQYTNTIIMEGDSNE